MFRKFIGLIVVVAAAAACAQDDAAPTPADPAATAASTATAATAAAPAAPMPAIDRVRATPKGELKNPYTDDNAEIVAQGKKLYMGLSCNGCHGGSAGGGMCPPLSNDTWVYGGDDDTLFRLVVLGSVDLQKDGYTRKGTENVVGPMPPHGNLIKSDDDLWKIMTFIRANYRGSPAKKFGNAPVAPAPSP